MSQKNLGLKALTLASLTLATLQAEVNQGNKTFLSPRPSNINIAMEYTTWHRHAYRKHAPTIRTHLQFTPFYSHSQQPVELGEYFGIGNGQNRFVVGSGVNVLAATADIQNNLLIHQSAPAGGGGANTSTLAGNVSFNPTQKSYGVRLDWFQNVTHPFDKLYFKANTTVVRIDRTIAMKVTNGQPVTPAGATQAFSLNDFFRGNVNVSVAGSTDLQTNLNRALIVGHRAATGLADLDVSLGYKYLDDEKKHVFLSLDLLIPMGNRVRGKYLFEPIYGNGRHVGLGGSVEMGGSLWEMDKGSFDLVSCIRYKYLFENTENRTLNVKAVPFSQYFLMGQSSTIPNQPLVPAANILNMPIAVKPGSMLDWMTIVSFHGSGFTVDAGYNLFWRDRESVHIRNLGNFVEGQYGIAAASFSTANAFNPAVPANFLAGTSLLKASDLNLEAARTQALFTNKIFAGLGYSWNIYEKSLCSAGLGGSYEFASSNADIENYAIWGKFIFSF